MSNDYIEWECEECGEYPNELNRVFGIPTRYLCNKCFNSQEKAL